MKLTDLTERQQFFLDVAGTLFGERGFLGTTGDEIASAAHVTKRTLYRHLHSKGEMLFLICVRFLTAVLETWDDILTDVESPTDALRRLMESYVSIVATRRADVRVFYEEFKHLDSEHRQQVARLISQAEDLLKNVIQDGVQRGELPDRSPQYLAFAILGTLSEVHRWYRPQGRESLDNLARFIADRVLHGIEERTGGSHLSLLRSDLAKPRPLPLKPSSGVDANQATGSNHGGPGAAADQNDQSSQERIFAAGIELFSAKGFLGTSTYDLASRSGLPRGTLYYHMTSKEELLFQIQTRTFAAVESEREAILSAAETPTVTLRLIVQSHCANTERYGKAAVVFAEEMKYLTDSHYSRALDRRRDYERQIEEVIQSGMALGEFTPSDPRLTTLVVFAMMNGVYRWSFVEDRQTPQGMSPIVETLIFTGLLLT